MRRLMFLSLTAVLVTALTLNAQTPTPKLAGRVLDSSGGVMPATDVKVSQGDRVLSEVKTNEEGEFSIELPAGEYRLEITAVDFTPHIEVVRVVPEMQPLSISLTLAILNEVVEVTEQAEQLAVSVDASLGTTTISGAQLADLPDDEEALAEYLQQLASSAGGAASADFVVDGFGGGRLPPRDTIQQIIIENNPFGAEGRGGPRVRIITRPGTGSWRGGFGVNFRDESLNARNPFASDKPSSQQRSFNPQFNGPLIPGRVSMNFSGNITESESEGESIRAITPTGEVASGVVSPNTTRSFQPRFTIFLNNSHRLNLNLQYQTSKRRNQGIGGFNLPERASNSDSRNWSIQIAENATFGTLNNELRFQMERSNSEQSPATSGLAINVLDAFYGGGAQNRSTGNDSSYTLENQIRTVVADGKMQINTGIELSYDNSFNHSESNYAGTYTFSSLHDYCYATNFVGVNCQETRNIVEAATAAGEVPSYTNSRGQTVLLTGVPTTFTQTSGNPELGVNQWDFNAYLETTLRATDKLALQMNLRYQTQTHLQDFNNIDPRLNVRYVLGQNTVISAGSGIFHDQGFSMGNYENLLRNDGTTRQFRTVISNPSFPDPYANGPGSVNPITSSAIRTRSADYVAPYSIRSQMSIEQTLPGQVGVTVSYQNERGLNEQRIRNINAPIPGIGRPDTTRGNINQYESVGKSWSDRVNIFFRQFRRSTSAWNFNVNGNYTISWSRDDAGTPVDNYDLAANWGRSNNDVRHRFRTNINLSMPWGLSISPNFTANSGSPYTITTGRDDNGDTETNDRPVGIVRNSVEGPGSYNLNTSFRKQIFLGSNEAPTGANNLLQRGGGGGGGGGPRGGGGPGGGFGRPTQQSVTLGVTANNLLNNTQIRRVSGVATSSFFGLPIAAAPARSITLDLRYNF